MKALLSMLVSSVLLATGACSGLPTGQHAGSDLSMVSWHDYGNLGRLVAASDLVVEARVLQRLGTRDIRSHPAQPVPVSFTETLVEVRSALKGVSPDQIRVVQVGKEGDPAQSYPEFPVLRPGTDVVLFLVDVTSDPIHAGGTAQYGILPPVGLLRIEDGRLRSSATGFEATEQALSLTLDEFRTRIRSLAGD